MSGWTDENVPDQTGKVVIITGANSGLGLESAKVLTKRGAKVILACRDESRGQAAQRQVGGTSEVVRLDLGDLDSVEAFAKTIGERFDRLDILLNNAGLMAIPESKTKQGFETQMGVNHLGHFALTGRLLPLLLRTKGARIVNVSSRMSDTGRLAIDDPLGEKPAYGEWSVYGNTKLANLLFTLELSRRLGDRAIVTSAHPGYAATELQGKGASMGGSKLQGAFMAFGNAVFAQSQAAGAWPQLRAATDPAAHTNDFYGPGFFGWRGAAVKVVAPNPRAHDPALAKALFDRSTALTGVAYPD